MARQRLIDNVKEALGNVGAGLRSVIEANGGRLRLESTGPDGSTLRISLQRAP